MTASSGGQVYGSASLVASATRGDGDPTGGTDGHPEDIDWETGYPRLGR